VGRPDLRSRWKSVWHYYALGRGHAHGVVFKLTPHADGSWKESTIHHFAGTRDGSEPFASLTFDQPGGLYGTTSYAGAHGFAVAF
jgi:hypothetical protein